MDQPQLDIVMRLRACADANGAPEMDPMRRAADEIELLRKERDFALSMVAELSQRCENLLERRGLEIVRT